MRSSHCPSAVRYELLDFGDGRKLEALGDYRLDRPSPAALGERRATREWQRIEAKYDRIRGDEGAWYFSREWPDGLVVDCGDFVVRARPTPFGHIGVFPEQQENWHWIQHYLRDRPESETLNLFAYTGASTLAAAAGGSGVTHVDAARPNVEAAKENAEHSGLGSAKIRYMVDDVRKFVAREQRRERRYDLIILDPPAYGHAKKGPAWRLQRDLWPLLEECFDLVSEKRGAVLLTGHSPEVGPSEVQRFLRAGRCSAAHCETGRLKIHDRAKRPLDAGFYCRIQVSG